MEIQKISLAIPLGMGQVNSYLIKIEHGFILIDTGTPGSRAVIDQTLVSAGCQPGDLRLIVITHGDFDHIGNAAYMRTRFGAKIGMGADDAGMAERGDMFWNRKKGSAVMRTLIPVFIGFGKQNRFSPDIFLKDGDNLHEYGLDASILSLPGHSKGSIGVLTGEGDLFCGDLIDNTKKPAVNAIMDDPDSAKASLEKLKNQPIKTVYPGHGSPFAFEQLLITL